RYDEGKLDEKVKVLHVIEPRRERNPLKLGVLDMPFASLHIEIDQKHLLQESGFNENPVIVFRFWKNAEEVYGRSPAMGALPDIRALNKLVEIFEKAGEMGLDPPKMVSTEDVLGAGKMPWGPGVSIPIHSSGRLGTEGRRPIEPIITVTNPSWAIQRISDLRDNVQEYFMLDRLSDLNNRSRQTLGEANIRNELRMYMTAPPLIRFLIELVGPFLDRAFNIMLSAGMFGVVRGSVQDIQQQMMGLQPKYISEDFINKRMSGLKGYRMNYISPAARLMKLEESNGLDSLTAFITQTSQLDPSVVDVMNFDETARAKQRLCGASQKVMRSPAEVEKLRQAKAQQQAEIAQLQQAQVGAAAFKDAAKGVRDIGGARSA
ncbi:MAG: head-tail connector protein, partial [Candidatus Obscuribacterales bacterium]|nr:head-tail connector protein [Candidatus Obscuribacterales bacterium]